MEEIRLDNKTLDAIINSQRDEITEYHIYKRLSAITKDKTNSEVLKDISEDELSHFHFWQKITGQSVKPKRLLIFWYYWICRIFGLTFGIKLLEKREEKAQNLYERVSEKIPEVHRLVDDEDKHERELISLLQEERLQYIGSVVLGLNDALVELTGTLAGLSFALRDTRLIALAGLITGIAASFSMAASEYLSTKSESDHSHALKSSIYTGCAYIFTVIFLILPFLVLGNYLVCLALTILAAIMIILVFNFYISVAKDLDFRKRFFEMALISLGVAALSFGIGYLVRVLLGVDI
ncbi:MAG: nodulin 21-related protein [Firmicutes bacterium]|nr:nodulin 21-related protein [Bacillota bacterium]